MNHPEIVLATQDLNVEQLCEHEWLVTNGLGGYASGTLLGIPTRRYHGLLVANLVAPKGRHVLISRYDEEIMWDDQTALLGGAELASDDSALKQGRWLKSFHFQNNTARWLFQCGELLIEKSIVMPHNQNTVCVRYQLLNDNTVKLRLRPYLAFRRQDAPLINTVDQFTVNISGEKYEVSLKDSSLILRMALRGTHLFVAHTLAVTDQILRQERNQGYNYIESNTSPGYFEIELRANEPALLIASAHGWDAIDMDMFTVFEAEERRLAVIKSSVKEADEFSSRLIAAADQFLILPGSRLEERVIAEAQGHELKTVIAGYHWFGDWGRDTMISLEGLMLCTRRFREARATLHTFAQYLNQGLLPNLFPEGERLGLYHTVDATLWYFHAIHRYVRASHDLTIITDLMPALQSIIDYHIKGTLFGIHMDPKDALIAEGEEGYQLTWMDAKVGDWVVTPRRGKPVEIQALWYNALCLMAEWNRDSTEVAGKYSALAQRAAKSFNARFWNPQTGTLLDVIDDHGKDDASMRPNQIFAISLDHPILQREYWQPVLKNVQEQLLTPFGLRTLSRDSKNYVPNYQGDLRSRDAAYHQGTVWPWLIGHFIDAWLKVTPDKSIARQMLSAFPQHLSTAGIGSISEIFDAEIPHLPRGCIAQAWSVAEVLRAWQLTDVTLPDTRVGID